MRAGLLFMSEAGGHSSEWPGPIAGLLPRQTSLATVASGARIKPLIGDIHV